MSKSTSEQLAIDRWLRGRHASPVKEATIVQSIMNFLKTLSPKPFIRKMHGGPYQSQLPDIMMLWKGTSFWFEVKRPGNNPTPNQHKTIEQIRQTMNHAHIVYSVDEARNVIAHYMMGETHVNEYTNDQLVERAVINATPKTLASSPRWMAVMDTFLVGSCFARELCRRYNLDPDEIVLSPNTTNTES